MADAKICDLCEAFYNDDPKLLTTVVQQGRQRPDTLATIRVFTNAWSNEVNHVDVDKNCVKKVVRAFMTKLGIRELPETVLDERYHVQEVDGEIILDSAVLGNQDLEQLFTQFEGEDIRLIIEVTSGK